jgi:uncharacterized protein (TIGR03000 family)
MFGKMFSRCGVLITVLLLMPAVALAGPGGHGGGGHFGGGHYGGLHYGGGHYSGVHYPGFGGLHYGGYHYHNPYPGYGYLHDYRDHHAHHGYYYYPYFGLYGDYYPYYGSYGDYYGSYDSPLTSGYSGDPAVNVSQEASAHPLDLAVPANRPPDASAQVTVDVPANARVWIDGTPTTSSGSVHNFITPLLKPGSRYTYQIKVTWNDNGHERTQTQAVEFTAGAHVSVDFPAPAQMAQPATTTAKS